MKTSFLLLFALFCSPPVRGQDPLDIEVVLKLLDELLGLLLTIKGGDGNLSVEAGLALLEHLLGIDAKVGITTNDEGGGDEGGDDGGDEGGEDEGGEDEGGEDEGGEEDNSCGEEDDGGECYEVETIDRSLNDMYCEQPYFVNFVTKTEENCLIDNVCYTLFPLPDDPYTFNIYRSTVFCDGSSRVETAIGTDISIGVSRVADPFCTFTSNVIGYAGCDTYIVYRCMDFGECAGSDSVNVLGLSKSCLPLGLSCLQKVQEIVEYVGIPEQDYFILPMKLPNRCVTEQICVNNIQGNFYRALNLPPPVAPPLLV